MLPTGVDDQCALQYVHDLPFASSCRPQVQYDGWRLCSKFTKPEMDMLLPLGSMSPHSVQFSSMALL
jgi:hypothetical protein